MLVGLLRWFGWECPVLPLLPSASDWEQLLDKIQERWDVEEEKNQRFGGRNKCMFKQAG